MLEDIVNGCLQGCRNTKMFWSSSSQGTGMAKPHYTTALSFWGARGLYNENSGWSSIPNFGFIFVPSEVEDKLSRFRISKSAAPGISRQAKNSFSFSFMKGLGGSYFPLKIFFKGRIPDKIRSNMFAVN